MRESRGQVSFEYLLIFSVSLIILIAFTLPLLENTMDNTFDVSDSSKVKSDLCKLSNAIMRVYGEGQGSKQTVYLDIDKPIKVNVASKYVSSNIKLKDNQQKLIKVNFDSKLKTTSFKLSKGEKTLIVEWPEKSPNMIIYEK